MRTALAPLTAPDAALSHPCGNRLHFTVQSRQWYYVLGRPGDCGAGGVGGEGDCYGKKDG